MASITLQGNEYELSTKLRVAYKLQGQHNHKPYAEIFQEIGKMGVEKQIGIIYASFEVANPEQAKKEWTRQRFQDEVMDNFNLKEMMNFMQEIIAGIMGTTAEEMQSEVASRQATIASGGKNSAADSDL
jgi:hypothetical protein